MNNTADVLYEAGTTCPSQMPWFTPGFLVGSMLLIFLVFCAGVVLFVLWLSSSCALCAQCCQCFWIVFVLCLVCSMLPVFLDCLRPVSCVLNVASVSGLSLSCVLCAQCCQCFWIVHFWLPHQFFLTFTYIQSTPEKINRAIKFGLATGHQRQLLYNSTCCKLPVTYNPQRPDANSLSSHGRVGHFV